MGRRHSKNAGGMGSEGFTYHERRALGFGTVRQRLGKDSHGNYYDCRLTLQPAVDPVVTPGGVLYSREAILESLLQQKKAAKRRLAEWEADRMVRAQEALYEELVAPAPNVRR
jgi:nitric oxide synthase-interacting protein